MWETRSRTHRERQYREALPLELGKVSEGFLEVKVSELRLEGGKGVFQVTGEMEWWCRGWGVGDCTGCCLPARLCSPLCDPVDCSPPGFSVHGILQARILAWVAVYLLQGISLTQGSRLHLLLGRWILYHWASREAWDCTYTGCTSNRTLSLQELFWVSAGEGSWASKQVLGQKVSRQLR